MIFHILLQFFTLAYSGTWYVNGAYGSDSSDCSLAAPCKTISHVVSSKTATESSLGYIRMLIADHDADQYNIDIANKYFTIYGTKDVPCTLTGWAATFVTQSYFTVKNGQLVLQYINFRINTDDQIIVDCFQPVVLIGMPIIYVKLEYVNVYYAPACTDVLTAPLLLVHSGHATITNCHFHNIKTKVPLINLDRERIPAMAIQSTIFENITCEANYPGIIGFNSVPPSKSFDQLNITNCTFVSIRSPSSTYGGAISAVVDPPVNAKGGESLKIYNSSMINCMASSTSGRGGALFLYANNTKQYPLSFTLSANTFISNSARYGWNIALRYSNTSGQVTKLMIPTDFKGIDPKYDESIVLFPTADQCYSPLPNMVTLYSKRIFVGSSGTDSNICGLEENPCMTFVHAASHVQVSFSLSRLILLTNTAFGSDQVWLRYLIVGTDEFSTPVRSLNFSGLTTTTSGYGYIRTSGTVIFDQIFLDGYSSLNAQNKPFFYSENELILKKCVIDFPFDLRYPFIQMDASQYSVGTLEIDECTMRKPRFTRAFITMKYCHGIFKNILFDDLTLQKPLIEFLTNWGEQIIFYNNTITNSATSDSLLANATPWLEFQMDSCTISNITSNNTPDLIQFSGSLFAMNHTKITQPTRSTSPTPSCSWSGGLIALSGTGKGTIANSEIARVESAVSVSGGFQLDVINTVFHSNGPEVASFEDFSHDLYCSSSSITFLDISGASNYRDHLSTQAFVTGSGCTVKKGSTPIERQLFPPTVTSWRLSSEAHEEQYTVDMNGAHLIPCDMYVQFRFNDNDESSEALPLTLHSTSSGSVNVSVDLIEENKNGSVEMRLVDSQWDGKPFTDWVTVRKAGTVPTPCPPPKEPECPEPKPDPGSDPDPKPDPGTDPDPKPDPGSDPDPEPCVDPQCPEPDCPSSPSKSSSSGSAFTAVAIVFILITVALAIALAVVVVLYLGARRRRGGRLGIGMSDEKAAINAPLLEPARI